MGMFLCPRPPAYGSVESICMSCATNKITVCGFSYFGGQQKAAYHSGFESVLSFVTVKSVNQSAHQVDNVQFVLLGVMQLNAQPLCKCFYKAPVWQHF